MSKPDDPGAKVTERNADGLHVHVFRDRVSAGSAAGRLAEEAVRSALRWPQTRFVWCLHQRNRSSSSSRFCERPTGSSGGG